MPEPTPETQIVEAKPAEVAAAPVAARQPGPNTALMALVPTNIQEAAYTAGLLARSLMFKHKTQEQAFAAIMMGRELGLPPASAMRAIDIIDGKPAPSADALVAACLRRNDICEYFHCVSDSPTHSTWATRRRGAPTERTISFTLEDAKTAGLTGKDVWKKYGTRMLGHRASAFLAREVYPDICLGMYAADEAEEIAEERRARAGVAASVTVLDEEANKLLRDLEACEDVVALGHLTMEAQQLAGQFPNYRNALGERIKAARARLQTKGAG